MKNLTFLLVLALLGTLGNIKAQEFTGVAHYKSTMSMNIELDSTSMPSDQQEMIQKLIQQSMQKDYKLTFNKSESLWKQEEKLAPMTPASNGAVVNVVVAGSGAGDELYKNLKEKRIVESSDLFGKLFLIDDKLPEHKWEMTTETKKIGQYDCYKAVMTREVKTLSRSSTDIDGDKGENTKEEVKEQEVVAWYTPQIPVSHGPETYGGLPGLILEISDGSRILVCDKVTLNAKEADKIQAPTKGKKVTQAAFEEILEKKLKEMDAVHGSPNRRGGDGETFSIKIGN